MLGRHPPRPEAGRGRSLAGHGRLLPQRRLRGGRVGPQRELGVERAERHGAGRQFNRTIFGLNFGLKNGLRFHFDCDMSKLPVFELFLSVGNLKPKLK